MRKVVDSNYLQSDELHKYLLNPKNEILLTDQVSCEAISSDFCRSYEILSKYPKQVVVLKRTQNILSMSLTSKGLQKRIICSKDTKNFRRLSNKILNIKMRDDNFNHQVNQMKNEAIDELKKIYKSSEKMATLIIKYFSSISKQEAKILRSGPPYNSDALSIILKNIEEMVFSMFSNKINFINSRNYKEFYNSYLFRSGVCGYFLFQDWYLAGGLKNVKTKIMMNDLLDAQIAAYATYGDGLLSHDKKIQRIYKIANYFICETKKSAAI